MRLFRSVFLLSISSPVVTDSSIVILLSDDSMMLCERKDQVLTAPNGDLFVLSILLISLLSLSIGDFYHNSNESQSVLIFNNRVFHFDESSHWVTLTNKNGSATYNEIKSRLATFSFSFVDCDSHIKVDRIASDDSISSSVRRIRFCLSLLEQ
jgi:hypothetical protein